MRIVLLLLAMLSLSPAVQAAELDVLTTGAFKLALLSALHGFEAQTVHKVKVDNDTAGALVKRISGGASFDLVVLTPAAIDDLTSKGLLQPGSRRDLARVGIGVAVKSGAPKPAIGDAAQVRQMLLTAKTV
ncbi:MAG: substrate-binding domain-containing protein, partial [Ferrovibrio sp.]